ncbi:ABC transporter ATP-binding protein [Periweissella cryptocerci]|nr:ABC transporter ATP-binding protein [Periweissella cryptocerci]
MEIKNFSYSIGKQLLFDDISLDIKPAMMNIIVGRNGIGKTVLLDLISNLDNNRPIEFIGFPTNKEIIYQTQGVPFMSDATIQDMVRMVYDIAGIECVENLTLPAEIKQNWNKRFGDLSGGERRLVTIWISSIVPRDMYIFDEPLANLDPNMANKVMNIMYGLTKSGKTVILATHQYDDIQINDTHMVYLKDRHVVYDGLVSAYLNEVGGETLQELFKKGL